MRDHSTGGSREYTGVSAICSDELDNDMAGAYITSDSNEEVLQNNTNRVKRKQYIVNPQPHDTHPDVAGRFVEGKGVVRTESNEELLLRMRERYHEHPLPAVMPNLMVGSRDARIPEEVLHRYQKEVGKNNTNPYKNIPTTQKIRVDGVVMCALEASQIWEEKQATRKMTNTLLAGHYEAKRIQQENLVEANRTVSTLNTALVNQYANLTEEQLQAVVAAQENAIIKLLMPKLTELVNEIIRGKV